jgi:hypothetical protein
MPIPFVSRLSDDLPIEILDYKLSTSAHEKANISN